MGGPTLQAQPAPPFSISSRAAVLMDAQTGQIIFAQNADERLEPASLSKIMTAYLAFEALGKGLIQLEDKVLISEAAWATGGSKMFVLVGDTVRFDDLLKGMTVSSGNDATVAIAERLGGTVEGFADMMNAKAAELGMTNSHFVNPHGLPAADHYASARDIAVLSRRHLSDHPNAIAYHSLKEYTYAITSAQLNRNRLLWTYPGADGLKTGNTTNAGYCLVATAKREQDRFIAVVMGATSAAVREQEATRMLDYAFANFTTVGLADDSQAITELRIWKGNRNLVTVGTNDPAAVTVRKGDESNITTAYIFDKRIQAPVSRGQKVGELVVYVRGEEFHRIPLLAMEDVPTGGIIRRVFDGVRFFFARAFRRI